MHSLKFFCFPTLFTITMATMGPLMPDTTALTYQGGGCVNAPGDSNARCTDVGITPDAITCSNICANLTYCSAITWHGPSTGAWAGHCIVRKDNVWNPENCGNNCDHTAANKTSGWLPYSLPWIPATKGYTSRIKTMWFGANSSGLDNPDTLELIAAHDVGIYGWQTGHPGGGVVGMGEEYQSSASTHLLDYLQSINNPNQTVIGQYRQIQVALRLFAQCALAADNPDLSGYFIHDSNNNECLAGQPWGTSDPFWDFTNSSAITYWLNSVINSLVVDGSLTQGNGAVFFDECDQMYCGYHGSNCDFTSFLNYTKTQQSYNQMFTLMVQMLNGANIVPILSFDNRLTASGTNLSIGLPCTLPEDTVVEALQGLTFVRFYETFPGTFWAPNGPDTDAAMIYNAILEGDLNISNILHMGGSCPAPDRTITRPGPLGGDIEFQVAVYLIVQSPGTLLSISNDWYDQSFCWRPDFNVDYGLPLGPPIRINPYNWIRNYTRANVEINVQQSRSGSVYLLA